jgi:hypothetical protein
MKILELNNQPRIAIGKDFQTYREPVVQLRTRPSGDIEVMRCNVPAGVGHDETIALIPKARRAELASFLTEAE